MATYIFRNKSTYRSYKLAREGSRLSSLFAMMLIVCGSFVVGVQIHNAEFPLNALNMSLEELSREAAKSPYNRGH